MRPAGDPVIAGAGLLGVDQQRKGTPPGDRREIGDAEHGRRIGRPVDTVAVEVPAIGGLPHAGEDVFEIEIGPGLLYRSAVGVGGRTVRNRARSRRLAGVAAAQDRYRQALLR
jgi:hypothetical protein